MSESIRKGKYVEDTSAVFFSPADYAMLEELMELREDEASSTNVPATSLPYDAGVRRNRKRQAQAASEVSPEATNKEGATDPHDRRNFMKFVAFLHCQLVMQEIASEKPQFGFRMRDELNPAMKDEGSRRRE